MIVTWVLNAALTVLKWVLDRFSFLPSITFPASLDLSIPIPLLGSNGGPLGAWFALAIVVGAGLMFGRLLMWLYKLIPFNG